jgi:guanylate kinase
MAGLCFVITGPSGVGNGTAVKELLLRDPTLKLSVSHTTRPPRKGEVDGTHYHFVTRDVFGNLVRRKVFLEYASYGGNFYGTSREWVETQLHSGADIVLEIECKGAAEVRRQMRERAVFIFLTASLDTLKKRIEKRGENTPLEIARRLVIAEIELRQEKDFDYRVSAEATPVGVAQAIYSVVMTRRSVAEHIARRESEQIAI